MGDPLKKVLPGQELSIPAEAYNAFIDATLAHRGVRSQGTLAAANLQARPAGVIKVRNFTANPLPRFAPVGIHSVAITPSANLQNFQNTPVLNVTAPGSPSHLGRFAVLQEPIAAWSYGDAVAWGVTVGQVVVNHISHDRADVDPSGGSQLVTAFYGAAEILYLDPGVGTRWAVLRIGPFVAPPLKAYTNVQIPVGGSGTVSLYRNGSAVTTVTAYLNWLAGNQPVPANTELLVQFFRDENKWVIVGAGCPTS